MEFLATRAVPLPSLTAGPRVRAAARAGVLVAAAVLLAVAPHLSSTLATLVGGESSVARADSVVNDIVLLTLAGAAGAWLGGRWWGCPSASLACGIAWAFAVAPELAGEPTEVFAHVLWPVVLGLVVRAVARREFAASVGAGLAAGPLLAADPTHAGGGLVALVLVGAVAGGGGSARAGAGAVCATAGLAVLVAIPVLATTPSFGVAPHRPLGTWALAALAALGLVGLARHRRLPRRILLPGLLALAGSLPLPALLRGAPLLPLAVALGVGGLFVGFPAYNATRRPSGSTAHVGGPSSKS